MSAAVATGADGATHRHPVDAGGAVEGQPPFPEGPVKLGEGDPRLAGDGAAGDVDLRDGVESAAGHHDVFAIPEGIPGRPPPHHAELEPAGPAASHEPDDFVLRLRGEDLLRPTEVGVT